MPGGRLRYERLSTWMGYKIFYDPTLHLMFATAIVGVLGLFTHFWQKFGNWSAVSVVPDQETGAAPAPVRLTGSARRDGPERDRKLKLPRGNTA